MRSLEALKLDHCYSLTAKNVADLTRLSALTRLSVKHCRGVAHEDLEPLYAFERLYGRIEYEPA